MEIGPGTVLGGKYRLVQPLARGGQGSVWVAHHVGLDVPIAIKFLTDTGADTTKARSRFEREARAAASLRSPHVVQVLDYQADGEVPFIVMELLEGEDMRKILVRRRRMPLDELSTMVTQLCKGLQLAHDAGIIHRDLKPGNVFVARVGNEQITKVLDFGVAKETALDVSQTDTTTGLVVGSPSYMSPEQARGGRVDGRSDLWSLAVVIFQAMTGKRPFDGTNLGDLLVHICSEPIPLPSHLAPDLPPAIDAFMLQALSRNPDQRFQNATEFARAFAEATAGASKFGTSTHDDATEKIAAGPELPVDRGASTVADAQRARAVDLLQPDPPPEEKSGTQATAAVDLRRTKRSRGIAPILSVAGVAVLVVGGWFAWDSGLFRSAPSAPASSAPTTAASVGLTPSAAPTAAESASHAAALPTAVESAPAPSSAPSASASVPAPTSATPIVPRQPWPPPRRPDPGPVDSKFGLPGGRR